jgi:hypothetical protein
VGFVTAETPPAEFIQVPDHAPLPDGYRWVRHTGLPPEEMCYHCSHDQATAGRFDHLDETLHRVLGEVLKLTETLEKLRPLIDLAAPGDYIAAGQAARSLRKLRRNGP